MAFSRLNTAGHGEKLFEAVCDLGLEGIMFKRLTSVYRSGPSRTWIKVKNPNAPAATRAMDGTFWKYFLGWTILNLMGSQVRTVVIGLLIMITVSFVILLANLID
jgi:hypothetical protein